MKIKRQKKVNKVINFYTTNFGFRQPYQILVDGTFCYAALNHKINIADNIPRYLHGEIKFLTTMCVILEVESLGHKLFGALKILKQYPVHKCGHKSKPQPGSKCLLSMLGKTNDSHYVIATQDRDLQEKVRNLPGVPLLYLHGHTPILEQPSEVTKQAVKNKSLGITTWESQTVEELKKKSGLVAERPQPKIRRKKKAKGPNPLSCKKKKNKAKDGKIGKTAESGTEKSKASRKIVQIPDDVRAEIMANKV